MEMQAEINKERTQRIMFGNRAATNRVIGRRRPFRGRVPGGDPKLPYGRDCCVQGCEGHTRDELAF